jgi:hypothetical protein
LAPSFAEAFFQRGVANFVCTAWPVDDLASERFARTLYEGLLGLEPIEPATGRRTYTPRALKPMHEAMLAARLKTAAEPDGAQSWGAYQHYGNPYMYFFDPASIKPPQQGERHGLPDPHETPDAVSRGEKATSGHARVETAR